MARVVTTQQTGKFWKLLVAVGSIAAIWGTIGWIFAENSSGNNPAILGCGLIVFVFGKLGGWWCHG